MSKYSDEEIEVLGFINGLHLESLIVKVHRLTERFGFDRKTAVDWLERWHDGLVKQARYVEVEMKWHSR